MIEVANRKPLPWYYGLVPPGWMLLQMAIMFSNMRLWWPVSTWTYLWGFEAFVTFVAMMWWLNRLTGPKSPRYYRFMTVVAIWVVACYGLWRWIDSLVPRPNYRAIGGTGEEHVRLSEIASSHFTNTIFAIAIGYFVVMFAGCLLFLRFYCRKKPEGPQIAS